MTETKITKTQMDTSIDGYAVVIRRKPGRQMQRIVAEAINKQGHILGILTSKLKFGDANGEEVAVGDIVASLTGKSEVLKMSVDSLLSTLGSVVQYILPRIDLDSVEGLAESILCGSCSIDGEEITEGTIDTLPLPWATFAKIVAEAAKFQLLPTGADSATSESTLSASTGKSSKSRKRATKTRAISE